MFSNNIYTYGKLSLTCPLHNFKIEHSNLVHNTRIHGELHNFEMLNTLKEVQVSWGEGITAACVPFLHKIKVNGYKAK